LESCSVTVTVTDAKSATASTTVAITVNKRNWNVVHQTSSDVWANWGTFPFNTSSAKLGENISQHTSGPLPIVGETQGNWDAKITRQKVSDSNGPFNDYWFNSSHSLRVERETRINQYLGGQVSGACFNWVTEQNAFAASPGGYSPVTNASTVRSGTVAHENQGNVAANFNSSPKQGGHSALFKAKQDANDIYNAAKEIEDIYSSTNEADLKTQDNSAVGLVDNYLAVAGQDPLTGNIDSWVISDFNCSTSAKSYNRLNN